MAAEQMNPWNLAVENLLTLPTPSPKQAQAAESQSLCFQGLLQTVFIKDQKNYVMYWSAA